MNILNRLSRFADSYKAQSGYYKAIFICVWFLSASVAAYADDVHDAYKLYKQGQHDKAFEKVSEFLAAKPGDARARFLLGLILSEQGKTAEAMETLSSLNEDYPELPEPYNNLAVLYASQGQYEKARLSLEMAIRNNPGYATAHENLGDIHARMAGMAYGRASELDHKNNSVKSKLTMIQGILSDGNGKASPVFMEPAPQQ